MRRAFIVGNWKMNLRCADALALALGLARALKDLNDRDLMVCPTAASLESIAQALSGHNLEVGAQNCAATKNGAFTGEVSAEIVASTGAKAVLLGHSERRSLFGETVVEVKSKLSRALEAGLAPILCVGESLEERDAGRTLEVVSHQTETAIANLSAEEFARVVLAYEPVWAIGTGRVATPEQAEEVHAHLRRVLAARFGAAAEATRILYGGSVKPDNVDGLMACPNIDGALVGGASLDPVAFERIARFASI